MKNLQTPWLNEKRGERNGCEGARRKALVPPRDTSQEGKTNKSPPWLPWLGWRSCQGQAAVVLKQGKSWANWGELVICSILPVWTQIAAISK